MDAKKILIVDDEEMIRKMLNLFFTENGYKVFLAENAQRALEILKEDRCQVAFLDLNMPGMNGLDLCRKIRTSFPITCIFAITGQASLFELVSCRGAGFDDYFTKPFDLKQLLKAAEDAFEKLNRWKKK
ncbi:MAG: response regulator [Deltaproteobacteria bacterium]|nr:response regulator [Deltaproteobacteria bacterium]